MNKTWSINLHRTGSIILGDSINEFLLLLAKKNHSETTSWLSSCTTGGGGKFTPTTNYRCLICNHMIFNHEGPIGLSPTPFREHIIQHSKIHLQEHSGLLPCL